MRNNIAKKEVKRLIPSEPGKILQTEANVPDAGQKPKITIRLYGSIRAAAGKNEEEIEITSGCEFYVLLQLLSCVYGDEFKYEVFRQIGDELRDDLIVSINGVIKEHNKLKNTQLSHGDIVSLLPNFSGGG